MKCYRYILYKLYTWSLIKRRGGKTPIGNVVFTMVTVHLIQLFAMYNILLINVDVPMIYLPKYLIFVILCFFGVCILYYYFLCTKEKCQKYLSEFQGTPKENSSLGTFMVLFYLVGSFVLFAISVWMISKYGLYRAL